MGFCKFILLLCERCAWRFLSCAAAWSWHLQHGALLQCNYYQHRISIVMVNTAETKAVTLFQGMRPMQA